MIRLQRYEALGAIALGSLKGVRRASLALCNCIKLQELRAVCIRYLQIVKHEITMGQLLTKVM